MNMALIIFFFIDMISSSFIAVLLVFSVHKLDGD